MLTQDQLEQHIDEHVHLQIFTYYGQSRTSNVKQLAENDIVLTTYQTLAADSKVYIASLSDTVPSDALCEMQCAVSKLPALNLVGHF